mmetsp:Transcript_42657/g.73878  ORF Transcript_42657/g.73878 Transcript_42657/m.73878 type:complete len:101 (+) Transcript_42657:3-305(+)
MYVYLHVCKYTYFDHVNKDLFSVSRADAQIARHAACSNHVHSQRAMTKAEPPAQIVFTSSTLRAPPLPPLPQLTEALPWHEALNQKVCTGQADTRAPTWL